MIEVVIGISSIELTGHADDEIVCAAVSAVTDMTSNYLENCRRAKIKEDDGYTLIYDVRGPDDVAKALAAFLKRLAREYPEDIKIKY